MQFVGLMPSCEVYRREGVEEARVVPSWPSARSEFRDFGLMGTFALLTDSTDLNHMGFILQFGKRAEDLPDRRYGLSRNARFRGEPFARRKITVINGGFNNLTHWEAARLASEIKPKIAIPCHYDMFANNSMDPRQFLSALAIRGTPAHYQEPQHGEPFVFTKD